LTSLVYVVVPVYGSVLLSLLMSILPCSVMIDIDLIYSAYGGCHQVYHHIENNLVISIPYTK